MPGWEKAGWGARDGGKRQGRPLPTCGFCDHGVNFQAGCGREPGIYSYHGITLLALSEQIFMCSKMKTIL